MESDVMFAFTAQPTEQQLAAAGRHASRNGLRFLRVFGILVVLYGALLVFFEDAPAWTAAIFVVLGLLVGWVLPTWKLRKAARTSVRNVGRPTHYRIDSAGVYSRNDLTEGTIGWPLVRRIEELPDQVLIRVGKVMFVPVPTGHLTPEVRTALLAYLRDHVGAEIPATPAAAPAPVPDQIVIPEPSPIRPPTPSA